MTNLDYIKSLDSEEMADFLMAIYCNGRLDYIANATNFLWDEEWLEKEIGGEENNMKGCGWVD